MWNNATFFRLAAAANRSMLSSINWYLDRQDPLCQGACNIGYAWISTWRELYAFDPFAAAVAAGALRRQCAAPPDARWQAAIRAPSSACCGAAR